MKMEYSELENLIGDIKQINAGQKYWMVRTMGGEFYKEFVHEGFIAVGYNEITLQDINLLSKEEKKARKSLKVMVKSRYPNLKSSGYAAAQILRFSRNIKEGDIVVAPSSGAHHIAFGVIQSTMYEEKEIKHSTKELVCPFRKRFKVDWKYTCRRSLLSPNLQLMFVSRHILSDITSYASYIDSVMHDFYEKDEEMHLVLRIRTEKDININSFFELDKLFRLTEQFCQENGIKGSANDVIMKIQMESPGRLRLSSKQKMFIWLTALGILMINGGGLKIESKVFKLDLSTNGLINNYNDFMDRKVDQSVKLSIKNALDSLDIRTPNDFQSAINLLHEQNAIRKQY